MQQRLTLWGHSCGIRLPSVILKTMKLRVGDFVNLRLMDNGEIRVLPVKAKQPADDLAADGQAQPVHAAAEKW